MRRVPPLLLSALLAGASPAMADLTTSNVAGLALKWQVPFAGVTGGPIVHDGRVYVGSWDSKVRALDPTTGAAIWTIDVMGAITGRVLVLDDGGICYGTLSGEVGCVEGTDGTVRWKTQLTGPEPVVVWSAPIASNGRLFVGVAGLTDQPCTRGRLVALDLADGHEIWRFYTVPEKVCSTDTGVECTMDGDCPAGGTCVTGVGGGVTATPAVDPTGNFVYMNTVGCYTFPSIGESDSMFKIEAATGNVVWRNRVNPREQFGTCVTATENTGIDCGTDADCAGSGGTCTPKGDYHDFGFLNGPVPIDVSDGMGGMKTLIVSGSKNGTLYAFDEATGTIAWTNVVRATPISPGFAGFGLFNGAIAYADGRIFAALYFLLPPRVCSNDAQKGCSADGDCAPGGTCPAEPKHLMAFDAATGATLWQDEIGRSWSHVAVANGVVYAGTQSTDPDTKESWLYAYDAATGQRLATLTLPTASAARAAIVGDTVYVGYGLANLGGVSAFSLCANGTVDPGEQCDVGPLGGQCCDATCTLARVGTRCGDEPPQCMASTCDAGGQCVAGDVDGPCDDGDACTTADQCTAGVCVGTIASLDDVTCSLAKLDATPCGAEELPRGLVHAIGKAVGQVKRSLAKAASLAHAGKTAKAEHLRDKATNALDALAGKIAKAATTHKASKRITTGCRDQLTTLLDAQRTVVADYRF